MMTAIFSLIVFCSIMGPAGLCLALYSRYGFTRIVFGLVSVGCALLMGTLLGTFFGPDIIQEILMLMIYPVENPS